jgi:hypothetical protein
MGYRLDGRGNFSLLPTVQTSSANPPNLLSSWYWGLFSKE